MGFFGDIAEGIGSTIGEMGRIVRTAHREQTNMTAELCQNLENIVQQAEAGNIDAMVLLADAYMDGTLLRYDPGEACRWWTMAANAGHRDSMYNLGLLYGGDLSKQFYNDELSAFWLNEAASRGDNDAQMLFNERFKYSYIFKKWVRK